jgi:hypothetical protein
VKNKKLIGHKTSLLVTQHIINIFIIRFFPEIHACNESENYLGILIHEIGIELKSLAFCTQIRCIRESHFTLDDALVKRHWNVEALVLNIKRCRDILLKHPEIIAQTNPILENMNENNSSNNKEESQ